MKVPAGILELVYKLALNNVGALAETPLEKIPHINVIAKAYADGQPLEVIIGLYLQATESVKDDELAGKVGEVMEFFSVKVPDILAKISERPAKDVLAELLGGLAIPDFDEKKGNEIKIIDIVTRIFDALKH